MPEISAVVPVHNSPYIVASLESLFKQTEPRLSEIIVVDDASTDETSENVRKISERDPKHRVTLIQLSENSGPAAAKNAGIKAASGSYVATIDSDMVLEEDCLRFLREDLLESGAAAAMAYFLVPRSLHVLTRVIGYDLEYRLSRILRGRAWACVRTVGGGATLYSKSALAEAGMFDESRRVGEDKDVGFRITNQGGRGIVSGRARCKHYWQNRSLVAYVRQQVSYGEGALRAYLRSGLVVSDPISNPRLRLNAVAATLSLLLLVLSGVYFPFFWLFIASLAFQIILDLPNSFWILTRRHDIASIVAPFIFLIRNYAWSLAVILVPARYLIRRNHSRF